MWRQKRRLWDNFKLYILHSTLLALRYYELTSRFLTQTYGVHWLFDILIIIFHCFCVLLRPSCSYIYLMLPDIYLTYDQSALF